jgi:branched-chain amino acid transport system ATP-binding protein
MTDLSVSGLYAGYGRMPVLRDVDLKVQSGEAIGVLGANGAGKSTLMRVLAGFVPLRSGEVLFDGERLPRRPSARVRGGVVLVPEGHEVVGSLTVRENLALGAFRFWPLRARAVVREVEEKVFDLFPDLGGRSAQLAGLLSGGQQQMLAISRALMARPRLLLLDEPSLGLAPVVIDQIYSQLLQLKGEGLSILIVEQNNERLATICDRTYVLRLGEVSAEFGPSGMPDAGLREAYFGT